MNTLTLPTPPIATRTDDAPDVPVATEQLFVRRQRQILEALIALANERSAPAETTIYKRD